MARWTVQDGDQAIVIVATGRSWSISIRSDTGFVVFTTKQADVVRDLRRKLGMSIGEADPEATP